MMFNEYDEKNNEYIDGTAYGYEDHDDYPPIRENPYPRPMMPGSEDRPPMHGPHPHGPEFDGRPPMRGPHPHGPEFDRHPPMRGPHPHGLEFDGHPPMPGGPCNDPHRFGPDFPGQPPMRGEPHFGPRYGDPEFEMPAPMPEPPESFDSFRELPFNVPGQYATLPVEGKLMHNFRTLSHQLHAAREGASGQKRILTILSAVPAISQRQLMSLLGVRAGTLSEVIGKLEATGKVRRVPNPNDRRTLLVSITPKGMASINETKESVPCLFDALTNEEKQLLLSLLEKMLDPKTPLLQAKNDIHEC